MRIKIIATGETVDAIQFDDAVIAVVRTGEHLLPYQYVLVDETDIIRSLRTMTVGVTLRLCIEPDDAERVWYGELTHAETKDFEFFVERAPHGCDVNIDIWDDRFLCCDIPWQVYAVSGSCFVVLLFALWGANHA